MQRSGEILHYYLLFRVGEIFYGERLIQTLLESEEPVPVVSRLCVKPEAMDKDDRDLGGFIG